jgi:hypothetical protein
LACAKTKRGKQKNRNIRSTLNCFSKGIDFENNSCLGSKRFFVNLALNKTTSLFFFLNLLLDVDLFLSQALSWGE